MNAKQQFSLSLFFWLFLVVPLTHSQIVDWEHFIGSSGLDQGWSIKADFDGNVYLAGYFEGTVDFDPDPIATANISSAGGLDGFIAKYDTSGNYVWAKSIGGSNDDKIFRLELHCGGDLLITGDFKGTADFDPGPGVHNKTSNGTEDIFLAKYDTAGTLAWVQTIGDSEGQSGLGLAASPWGEIYFTGIFDGTVDFDPGPGSLNLTSNGGTDIFFSTYSSDGTMILTKQIGGTGTDYCFAIHPTVSGKILMTGWFEQTVDFDPNSGTSTLSSSGQEDMFIAEYDRGGELSWVKQIGSTGSDRAYALALSGRNEIYVTGWFSGTVDFDPGTGTSSLSSTGDKDAFVAKYDALGNYLGAYAQGTTNFDYGFDVCLNQEGDAFISGSLGNNQTFISKYSFPGGNEWTHTTASAVKAHGLEIDINPLFDQWIFGTGFYQASGGSREIYFAKITDDSPASKIQSNPGIIAYPNPAKDYVILKGITEVNPSYQIISPEGKLIQSGKTEQEGSKIRIDLRDLPEGSFFICLSSDEDTNWIKILKH